MNSLTVAAKLSREYFRAGRAERRVAFTLVVRHQFEQIDDGYGNYTYSATVKNTSDLSFENVSLVLGLYDSDGVRQGESYVSANTWAAGETVKFEGYGTINAAQIKVEINYYEVAK
jgi:hypothetical protein